MSHHNDIITFTPEELDAALNDTRPMVHCSRCGAWVSASEDGRCGHTRILTDLLTQRPALMDELIETLHTYAIEIDVQDNGLRLPSYDEAGRTGLRALILAWVQRVEMEQI